MSVMTHMYSACTYSVWISPRITETETWNCAVVGELLVSAFVSFVSNCKWHSTAQIQLLITAHDKYRLWRVEVCGS